MSMAAYANDRVNTDLRSPLITAGGKISLTAQASTPQKGGLFVESGSRVHADGGARLNARASW
ncbi:MAG: hypothetical protein U1F34_07060 [Gammaproteobacteria bacterium]